MPILKPDELSSYSIPPKSKDRLRVAISHEFVELYRGDKDLRIGKYLCNEYDCEVVQLGTDIASPSDSRFFDTRSYPADRVGELPERYYLLLMKSKLIYHRKGNVGMGGFFRITPGIIKYLLAWKPDIILENPYLTLSPRSFMTYVAARMLGIPIVYMDSGDIVYNTGLKNKLVLPFEKSVVKRAGAVITYNNEGRKRFIKKYGYPSEKIYVIPKPMDTDRFGPHVDSGDFRQRYSLGDKFTVAYFGRLCTNKGARYLLYAADILRQKGLLDNINVLFVGDNVEANQTSEFSKHLNKLNLKNVTLTGMIKPDEMPQAYASVDLAVFPDVSNPPGFSTVLAESMASGLPIIIGNKGWEQATPIVDHENGLIINPGDPGQIASSIELLMGNHELRRKISSNALKYAREQMDYSRITAKYYAIMENVLAGRNAKSIESNLKHVKRESEKTTV